MCKNSFVYMVCLNEKVVERHASIVANVEPCFLSMKQNMEEQERENMG